MVIRHGMGHYTNTPISVLKGLITQYHVCTWASSGFIYGFTEEDFQVRAALQTYFGGFPWDNFQVRVDFRT